MKKLFTLLMFCSMALFAFADKQVNGVVVNDKGEPLIGATVQVEGTTLGTITDYDGEFAINVPDDAKMILVKYMGMVDQRVAIKKNMRIVMQENSEMVQEIVVTGYGNVSKGSYAGSAQAVDAESIEKKSPTEVTKALAGEVAGVQVINTSGQPGTNATLVIRGPASINGSSTPLYVVDGITYDGDISAIDPGDIASTTILKDATATSLYGARGANGVVVITTKKGTSGEEGKIDVDVKYGANMRLLPLYETIQNPEEYVTMAWQSLYNQYRYVKGQTQKAAITSANSALYSSNGLPVGYNLWQAAGKNLIIPTDANGLVNPQFDTTIPRRVGYENLESWEDAIFGVGQKVDASVRFHGGSETVNYYTSVGYLYDEGYYQSSDYSRLSVRSNIDYKPKKWLKAGLNFSYTYSDFNAPDQDGDGAMNNGFYYINAIPSIYPVYLRDADGNTYTDPATGMIAYDYGNENNRTFGWGINPAGSLRLDKSKQTANALDIKSYFEVKLYDGLKFTANIGANYYNILASDLTNKYYGDAAGVGRITQESVNQFAFDAQEMLEYNKTFGDHTIRVMAGHENYLYQTNYVYGSKSYMADGSSISLSNAIVMTNTGGNTNRFALDSYFASLMYSYNDRYVVTANYRADGSSRYAPGHRWGNFGSVGVAWNFTNESFLSGNEWIKNGKLRLSWGVLGNQISSLYSYTNLWNINNVDNDFGYTESSKGNEAITWERANTTDLGLEFSIGKYLDVELDYFYKLVDNMLFSRATAPSLGYSSIPNNDAKMANSGFEFTLKAHAVDTRNVKLDLQLNGAHYTNKCLQMPVDYYGADGEAHRQIMSGAMSVGHSLYDHYTYVYAGVDPTTGAALYEYYYDDRYDWKAEMPDGSYNYIPSLYKYEQEHADDPEALSHLAKGTTSDADYATAQYVGKSYLPGVEGGLGLSLDVYGVTLDISTSYRIGGYGYDYTYLALMDDGPVGGHNWHVDMRNAWTENNTETDVPALTNGASQYATYTNTTSTRFLTSNSYFSLNNIQLGYNFKKKWIEKIKLNKLNIYVNATNLAIATARKGYNPMTSFTGSSDTHGYSPLSTIMGGVKLTF